MKKLVRKLSAFALLSLVAFVVMLASPAPANAQKRKPNPSPPSNNAPANETQTNTPNNLRTMEQATLEMSILMSKKWTPADAEREQRRLAAQIQSDLERLAQIEAESIAPISSTKPVDYKNLAHATAEIKDRATKIKFNLPFVLKDRGEKVRREADVSQLGSMLPELSRAIKSFIGNPALRVNSPNDAELLAAAGHDMEGIIKLSETINKIAKNLSKTLVASK